MTLSTVIHMSPCITHSPQIYMMDFLPTGDTVLWHVAGQEILISLSHSWLQHTMSFAAVQGFSCLFCSTLSLMSWLHLLGFYLVLFVLFAFLFCFVSQFSTETSAGEAVNTELRFIRAERSGSCLGWKLLASRAWQLILSKPLYLFIQLLSL